MPNPYWNKEIRDWYFEGLQAPDDFVPMPVLVDGWGPFDQKDFDLFLMRHGIDSTSLEGADPEEIVVVGTEEWSAEGLTALVRARMGQRLRVYSQEMFLAYMKTGIDPFGAPSAVLEAFAEDHQAIAHVRRSLDDPDDWFTGTISMGGSLPLPNIGSPSPGLLKVAGYEVGNSGVKRDASRQATLTAVYLSDDLSADFQVSRIPLRGAGLASYLEQWGTAESIDRLKKMAETIASFCRNARKRQTMQNLDLALHHWETDLAWLLEIYPRGPKPNWWPSTFP